MGGQGDVAVGDRDVGDYRRWVPAEPQAESAQPLGNFSSAGRTLDGHTVTLQTQENTISFGEGYGMTNRRPGGIVSSNAATRTRVRLSRTIMRTAVIEGRLALWVLDLMSSELSLALSAQ